MSTQFELDYFCLTTGNSTIPTASLRLKFDGKPHQEAACGNTDLQAIFNAIIRVTGITFALVDYQIETINNTNGIKFNVIIKVNYNNDVYQGESEECTDISKGTVLAFLDCLNQIDN